MELTRFTDKFYEGVESYCIPIHTQYLIFVYWWLVSQHHETCVYSVVYTWSNTSIVSSLSLSLSLSPLSHSTPISNLGHMTCTCVHLLVTVVSRVTSECRVVFGAKCAPINNMTLMSCCNTACEMRIPLFWSFCLCKFLSDVGESNDRYSGKLH